MIDFEKLRKVYKISKALNVKDVMVLVNAAKKKQYEPGDFLIKEGSMSREVFFINKGLIRVFAINDKGEEITTGVRYEDQMITSPNTVLFDQPAQYYFQAIERTETYSMDYEKIQNIMKENPKLEPYRKIVLQVLLKQAYKRIDTLILLTPEERYIKFVEDYPELQYRLHGKYIANILGITPVSLSRIRKRIATKKK
ncbi:MAG: Crp/Fnr family transcriptional regulator [Bacteroidota bacterium]